MSVYLPVAPVYGVALLPLVAVTRNVLATGQPDFSGAIPWICVSLPLFVVAALLSAFLPILDEIVHNPLLPPSKKLQLCRATSQPILGIVDHLFASIASLGHMSAPAFRRHKHGTNKTKIRKRKS
jgi:hypothetical protein